MQPLHSREIFHSKNKTKPQQKKGNIFIVPPHKETFTTKLPVARKRKKTTQGRNGNRTHLSHTRRERRTGNTFVLRLNTSVVCREFKVRSSISIYIYTSLPIFLHLSPSYNYFSISFISFPSIFFLYILSLVHI